MTQILHQLRTRSRALAHGLLLVLLATWLSAVCPHCLAQTGISGAADVPAPEFSMHCHGDTAPLSDAHGDCPQPPVCTGGDCAQLTAIESGEPLSLLMPSTSTPAFAVADLIDYAYPSMPPPAVQIVHTVVPDACPLYLRHCAFLN